MPIAIPAGTRSPRVRINYSDFVDLDKKHVEWSPKGVRLLTKWNFAVGTEIEFAFDHDSHRHCCVGIVVACQPLSRPAGHYSTILFFIEVPCPTLRHAACDCQLAHERHRPADESNGNGHARRGRLF